MGSLSLGEIWDRGIVCVRAKQQKKKSNGKLLLRGASDGREKRFLSVKFKTISRYHKPLCEMKLFNVITHVFSVTLDYMVMKHTFLLC